MWRNFYKKTKSLIEDVICGANNLWFSKTNKKNAEKFLKESNGNVKIAIIMILHNKTSKESEKILMQHNNSLSQILK